MTKPISNIQVLQLASYVRPDIVEQHGKEWVLNGKNNEFFQYIIDRYNGSPTNSAIIDSYSQMIYGLGLSTQNERILSLLPPKEVRRICKDFEMFGMAAIEVHYEGGVPSKCYHAEVNKLAPEKADDDGDIRGYYYSYNWKNTIKYAPKRIDAFGFGKGAKRIEILCIKDYQVGQFYFSNPAYISALPYAELEEEIANYCINHIKNGLSFGHVINMNNGQPESEEIKQRISAEIRRQLTGSSNAGKFVLSFNDNKETATTVEALTVSDAHQQYQFLSEEARLQICVGHKVVSGAILGINKATGFSSNADEIETAFNETMLNVIQPKQEIILDAFQEILEAARINETLSFVPLRESMRDEAQSGQEQQTEAIQMSTVQTKVNTIADYLIELGEVIDDNEWELVDERQMNGIPQLSEISLHLASVPSSFPNVVSEQDTSLFKVRYQYAGAKDAQREFCTKMMKAEKVYRKEDIELAGSKVVNPGFGPNGSDTYNIWLYKGGPNCYHFWMRKIYLRRNNKSISVNDARRMILELDPNERSEAQWQENDPKVAKLPIDMPNNGYLNPR
jgi:hypothetical protein